MISVLLIPAAGRDLGAELAALLPLLEGEEQLLVAEGDGVIAAVDALDDPRCVVVGAEDLLDGMTGTHLLCLASGRGIRAGGLERLRALLRDAGSPPAVRFPVPEPADPEDPFEGRRRRLFGVPLSPGLTKPYVLGRELLAELASGELLRLLRADDPAVLLAVELFHAGGPGSGAWAPEPLLEAGAGAGDGEAPGEAPLTDDELRRFYEQYIERSGRAVTLRRDKEVGGTGLRVQARRPRGIDIELTTRCNARCIFCPQQDLPRKQHMSDAVFERVLAAIREQPLGTIYFIGRGEPLVHPRFLDYVREIRNWTGIEFEVFTNGLALTPEVVDGLAALNDPELSVAINVSLHSLQEETHRRLTGTELRVIRDNLDYLHRRGGGLRIAYAFVKNKINEPEMARLRRHLDRTGNRDWDISLIYNKGGYVAPGELFDEAFYARQLKGRAARVVGAAARGPCWYSYSGQYYFVNVHGQFTLCHDDFDESTILGEVGVDSLEIVDERVAALRAGGGAPRCGRCNKRQREAHHGGFDEEVAQVKGGFTVGASRPGGRP